MANKISLQPRASIMTPNGRDTYKHEWQRPPSFQEDLFPLPWISQTERSLFVRLLGLLAERFGVLLEAKPPAGLAPFPSDLWEPLMVANQLKELGVIHDIRKQKVLSDEPKLFMYAIGVEGADPDKNGSGASFFSEPEALWAAIGEAVDRYSLIHFSPKRFRDAPYSSLAGRALDIFSLAGISSEQRAQKHSRYRLQFDQASIFRWVEGHSLTSRQKIMVPLQLVTFYHWPREKEALLRMPVSTGNAAGKNIQEATYRGMLEVIERDAFMITWLKRLSPPVVNLESFESQPIRSIREAFRRYRLELKVVALPTDVPCHVMLAAILDRTRESVFFTLGMKASRNLEESVIGAIQEALSSRFHGRGSLPADPKTLPSFEETDKIGRLERFRIWGSRPELESEMEFLWHGDKRPASELSSFPQDELMSDALERLLEHFRKTGTEVVYVENLPEQIRGKIPLTSVYVVIPGFQPLHLSEILPYFSGGRLQTVPEQLGYRPIPGINTTPHPFP